MHHFLASGEPPQTAEERLDSDSAPERTSRSGFLARVALGLGAMSAGAAAAGGLTIASGSSSQSRLDREVLEFAIGLERLQAAFYTQALNAGRLSGEARQLAQVVGGEERAHLRYLEHALGSSIGKTPRYRFGPALTDQNQFLATAVELEDTGLAAYNGQATNLSPDVRAKVGRVISVEARHAAWARGLAGQQPAPVAVDVPISSAKARAVLRKYVA